MVFFRIKKVNVVSLCTFVMFGSFGVNVYAVTPGKSAQPEAIPKTNAAQAPANVLNQKSIHDIYNDGDFDKVISTIDVFTKANKTYSRADSIFISKHLAVVYSANPKTREKGRYYMYRMLEMMPTAELVDMFVSDEIDRIFEKVRKEFLTRQKGFGVDSTQISTPQKPGNKTDANADAMASDNKGAPSTVASTTASTAPKSTSPVSNNTDSKSSHESSFKNQTFWIAAAAGVAIAGATAVFIIMSNDSPAEGKTITIPSKSTASN